MDISFIILTWNSHQYVERCLDSIVRALGPAGLDYEVLMLDNGSGDGTVELLRRLEEKYLDRLVVHYRPENLGTTRSRNILLRVARGKFVCVMDSDVEFDPGVFEEMLPYLRRDPQLGMVVPRIVYPSGAWQKSFDRFPTVWGKIERFFRLREIEERQGQELKGHVEPFAVDYAISAFWLMRREMIGVVGLLDERIFYAPEDVDYCLRVWRAGYRILYVPSVTITHHTQEISRGFKLNRAKLSHVKGLIYYFIKHRYLWRRPRFAYAQTDG